MAGHIEQRLQELAITLPAPQQPRVAKIEGAVISGSLLYVSGMIPQWEGDLPYVGKVGREFSIEEGRLAARLSALNVLAQAKKGARWRPRPHPAFCAGRWLRKLCARADRGGRRG